MVKHSCGINKQNLLFSHSTDKVSKYNFWRSIVKVRKAENVRTQYNQVRHLTQDTPRESDKNTIKHHKQEPRGQPFPSRK